MNLKVIEPGGYNAVARWKYGYLVYNRNDIYIGRAIEKYGEFSESEVQLFRQLCRPGDIVVEVGANIGAHTVALAGIVGGQGRIYAFEPQRIVHYTLCANVAINSIDNVECFNVAVGASDGFVLIPDFRYDQPGNFGGISVDKFEQGRRVPCVRLDGCVDVPHLRLLKVDVEGMESEVVRGAEGLIARHRPALYVENDRLEKSQALIEQIRALDYRLYWHLPPLYNPDNYAGDGEDIYPGIVSVNMLCFPRDVELDLQGFVEVDDSSYHPFRERKG
jgi:FkbM family methyltransferase